MSLSFSLPSLQVIDSLSLWGGLSVCSRLSSRLDAASKRGGSQDWPPHPRESSTKHSFCFKHKSHKMYHLRRQSEN